MASFWLPRRNIAHREPPGKAERPLLANPKVVPGFDYQAGTYTTPEARIPLQSGLHA